MRGVCALVSEQAVDTRGMRVLEHAAVTVVSDQKTRIETEFAIEEVPWSFTVAVRSGETTMSVDGHLKARLPDLAHASLRTLRHGIEGRVGGRPATFRLNSFGLRARSRSVVLQTESGDTVGTLLSPFGSEVTWGRANRMTVGRSRWQVTTDAPPDPSPARRRMVAVQLESVALARMGSGL